ncbi:rod shape-determining protein RodA [Rhodovibrionaceae bacterium A322]
MSALDDMTLRRNPSLTIGQKFLAMNWLLVLLICAVASVGFAMLYSAANGSYDPWTSKQMIRFAMGLVIMLTVALVDIRFWFRVAYPLYFLALGLLVAVEVVGSVGMGAQRWIDLKVIQLQPSELMKVALVLALARYFHSVPLDEIGRLRHLLIPFVLIGSPVVLVLKQPDLGTALMLVMVAGAVFFAAGVRIWKFVVVAVGTGAAIPIIWSQLRPYQQRRVLTFLDPESDPLGAGYHITQSKIALGSGGLFGRGFLEGTQSHLSFLPEKQTDFIFTMLAEEFGLIGGIGLMVLFLLIFVYGFAIALRSNNHFGRLLALGLTFNLFCYFFINIAMVMGLVPVVGVPLPLISYGGTVMLTVMLAFGLTLSVSVHRDLRIPRRGPREDI